jgi:hypothetical protein
MNKKSNSRRWFLKTGVALSGFLSFNNVLIAKDKKDMKKNMFIHHVYFWLKNPGNKEDFTKLVNGLEALSKVGTIKMCHIGKPADTNREVIDRSYPGCVYLKMRQTRSLIRKIPFTSNL